MKQRIKKMQLPLNFVMILLLLACLLPFLLLLMSSLTDEVVLARDGYKLIPAKFGLESYKYLGLQIDLIKNAFFISVVVTISGTAAALFITTSLGYVVSRKDYPAKNIFAFAIFFTMLFNGGLVPTFLMYTKIFDIKNTIWALIIPSLLMNGFSVFIMKAYFTANVPPSIRESAYIDGAGEFRTFFQIVVPTSLPIIATIGLFYGIAYWNDWMNGLYYLTNSRLYSIQNVLNRILSDAQFLSQNDFGTQTANVTANIPTTGVRMAIAVVAVVPIMAAYPFFQKYFVKGITIGAVKG